ncbi:MAG: leucine-rich repeat domain-containing protein [Clostridia bacterium]|nr:leucine-rich repeat domain-containing protein [Clostridia bacterium]
MMERTKRVRLKWILRMGFCLALIAAMVLIGAVMASAEVYSGECGAQGDNVTWTLDTETGILKISGEGEMSDYSNRYVNYRAPWCKYQANINSVVVEDGITQIGAYAFAFCYNIKNVDLSDSVFRIEEYAFTECTSLSYIFIPKETESINTAGFKYCRNLSNVEFEIGSNLSGLGASAFYGCTSLQRITIPHNVKDIPNGTFAGCTSLESVQFLNNSQLEAIRSDSFINCSNLNNVVLPEKLKLIEPYAFYNCKSLNNVSLKNEYGWFYGRLWNSSSGIGVGTANICELLRDDYWVNGYIKCTPTQFTITFIADGKTVATVPYWNTDHSIEIPAVPHKPGYTGVWEDFDLSNGGNITVHAIYTPTESKLTGASVSLGQSLALNYYAVLTPAHTAAQMRFTYHGETTLVSGVLDEASGEYKFIFGRIPPQCMGDNVKAELILISEDGTETVLDVKETYSVRAYCDDALAANPENEALATLLADLLAYGDAAQDYANYNEDTPVSDGFTVAPSEWEDVTDTDFTLSDKTREDFCFSAAGVRFAYVNRVYFKIKAADLTGVTLTVNGKTYTADDLILVEDTADTYILYTDAVYATEFDKVFTAELVLNGEKIQTVTYSVKSYVCKKQNSSDTEIAALVKALYNYGLSAIAYKNAQ